MGGARTVLGLAMAILLAGCGDEVTGPAGSVRVMPDVQGYQAGTMAELTMVNDTVIAVYTRPCADRLERLTGGGWERVDGYDDTCEAISVLVPAGENRRVVASLPRRLAPGAYRTQHLVLAEGDNTRRYRGQYSAAFRVR